MSKGWSGRILRVDLSKREWLTQDVHNYTDFFIGGRGIGVKIVYDEVDPMISPFDPANKICFCPGVLSGTSAPGTSRMEIVGMSTNGLLTNSGCGAFFPAELKYAGYDTIVVQGRSDKPVYLYICDDRIEFKDASHIWGKDVFEAQQMIKQELGSSTQAVCIGPAGEKLVRFASVHTDWRSAAGRYGFGAIMGSKNLKAIAARGTCGVKVAKMEGFVEAAAELRRFLGEHDCAPLVNRSDSTLPLVWWNCGMAAIGNFESADWDAVRPTTPDEVLDKYGVARLGCLGCPRFVHVMVDIPGLFSGGGKCTGMASVTLGVWNTTDWVTALHSHNLCDKYGLDVTSTMNIVAFLMELHHRGMITAKETDGIPMRRGDKEAIISTIHKIGKQEGFGQLFRSGLSEAARTIGNGAEDYAMVLKGTEPEPYEMRAYKQLALAVAVSNRGSPVDGFNEIPGIRWAQENAGGFEGNPPNKARMESYERVAEKLYGTKNAVRPDSYEKQGVATWDQEGRTLVVDMLGQCKRMIPWTASESLEMPAKLFSLATGVDASEADLLFAAQRVMTLQRAFNVIKGVRRKDDTLPRRFFEEPAPGGPYKGAKLDKEKFDEMLDEYYATCGWDKDGIPEEKTFKKYGLSSEWAYFKNKLQSKEVLR